MRPKRQTSNESDLFQSIVWGTRHDAFDSPLGRSLVKAYSAGACDEEIARLIQDQVRPLKTKEAFGELDPFRRPQIRAGQIEIGSDLAQSPIRFPFQWLNAGLLILGNTGSGKTNFLKYLILQIVALVGGFWCTDMYKADLRHLRAVLARANKDLLIIRPGQLKLNILQADSVDPRGHLSIVVDLLARVLGVPPRAMTILRSVIDQLYEEFGIYKLKTDSWPTLFDVYERIRAAQGLNVPAKEALLDRLGTLLTSLTPQAAAWRVGWRPSDLSKRLIVFEFNTASEQVKSLLLNYLLFSVLRFRVASGYMNTTMNFWCLFEDAQRFFSTRGETSDITPAVELAGLIRGTGTGLAFAAQSMAGLPSGLLPNLASKIMCRMGSHSDYLSLGADMGMTPAQIRWATLNLRPGIQITQFAEGPWRLPFVAQVPEANIPVVVDDREANASVSALDDLPTAPALEFADWRPGHSIKISIAPQAGPPPLSETETRYLKAIIAHKGKPSSVYAKIASISGKRAADIRKRLVNDGYLREHTVATGRRGRGAIVLEPLDRAYKAIGQLVK